MAEQIKVLLKDSFGACYFSKMSPGELSNSTTTVNFKLSFEDALKLNLAIDECVRKLNGYNRAKTRGKNAALVIVCHLDKRRIRIVEGKL